MLEGNQTSNEDANSVELGIRLADSPQKAVISKYSLRSQYLDEQTNLKKNFT